MTKTTTQTRATSRQISLERVFFRIGNTVVEALALDDRAKWPEARITATRTTAFVNTTRAEARLMLDECRSRSARVDGEGWDQPASWGRACRVAAARIRSVVQFRLSPRDSSSCNVSSAVSYTSS